MATSINVVESGAELWRLTRAAQHRGVKCGLVPTMGALHEGHLSLVAASRECCELTIATIFVNPTQFAPHEDFDKYPRTLEADLEALAAAGADVCFVPSVDEMFPPAATTWVEPPEISRRWEGECRPGHFRGVATVVLKLFNLAPADMAWFGEKDFQQAAMLRQMAADLRLPIEVRSCPTVRDHDGLALSSRNRYLTADQRRRALAIPRSLDAVEALAAAGESRTAVLEQRMRELLEQGGVDRLDYAVVVDAETLAPAERLPGSAVALIAAHVGTTRLIDNRRLQAGSEAST